MECHIADDSKGMQAMKGGGGFWERESPSGIEETETRSSVNKLTRNTPFQWSEKTMLVYHSITYNASQNEEHSSRSGYLYTVKEFLLPKFDVYIRTWQPQPWVLVETCLGQITSQHWVIWVLETWGMLLWDEIFHSNNVWINPPGPPNLLY